MSPELLKEEADFYGLTDSKFVELFNKWTIEVEMMEMKMEIQALTKRNCWFETITLQINWHDISPEYVKIETKVEIQALQVSTFES